MMACELLGHEPFELNDGRSPLPATGTDQQAASLRRPPALPVRRRPCYSTSRYDGNKGYAHDGRPGLNLPSAASVNVGPSKGRSTNEVESGLNAAADLSRLDRVWWRGRSDAWRGGHAVRATSLAGLTDASRAIQVYPARADDVAPALRRVEQQARLPADAFSLGAASANADNDLVEERDAGDPDGEVPIVGRVSGRIEPPTSSARTPVRRMRWRPGVVTQLCTASAANVRRPRAAPAPAGSLPTVVAVRIDCARLGLPRQCSSWP